MNITVYTSQDSLWTIASAISTTIAVLLSLYLSAKDPRKGIIKVYNYELNDNYKVSFLFSVLNKSSYATIRLNKIDMDIGDIPITFNALYYGEIGILTNREFDVRFYQPGANSNNVSENFGTYEYLIEQLKEKKLKYKSAPILTLTFSTGNIEKLYPSKEAKSKWKQEVQKIKNSSN